MKNLFLVALIAGGAAFVQAQSLVVEENGVGYSFAASQAGSMVFGNGNSLTAMGMELSLTNGTEMYVCDDVMADNTVTVCYDGDVARVMISGNVARYVTATADGAHVTLTQSDEVGEDTCGEISYLLSGCSSNGSLTLKGAYKSTVELHGLELTNPGGAAIDIQNGKRIEMSVKSGTVNSLTDGSGGDWKGCVVCKGHLELKGKGVLSVSGNTAHAIQAKEYVEMKNCTVNVLSAVKDGINCNQYFLMESGLLNIGGVGDDAVQVSFKDDEDREAEDTGSITIAGGTINATVTAAGSKGLKADGDITVTGGDITVAVSGGGVWDSAKSKTKASSCMSADGAMTVSGGVMKLTATGGGGKGISCDGNLTIEDGEITVNTSGGIYAYVNGTEYNNYTGNTDYLDSDQKSSPKGLKADGDILIGGGVVTVTTTGNGGEGIESKATLTVTGGTIKVKSYDDAINSSSHMYIKGGDITVVATNNDGLDSNGNMYISGGVIRAFGASAPECGIDAAEEEGYSVYFTGGVLLAVGGGNSVPSSSESTQPYVSGTGSVSAGSTIEIKSGNEVLASFTVPSEYTSTATSGPGGRPGGGGPGGFGGGGSSILVTCPGLSSGSSYTLVNGSSSSTVTARLTGAGSNRPW